MPRGAVPDRYRDLLEGTTLGHLATVDPDGRPQVNQTGFTWDSAGDHVLPSVKPETNKYRNLRGNPAVAMSVSDPARPGRFLEIRGTATELKLFDTLAWVNVLARKYTGADFAHGSDGEHRYRYMVTIRVDSWTAQNSEGHPTTW